MLHSSPLASVTGASLDRSKLAELRELAEPGEEDPVKELLELYVADGQRYLLDILTAHATKSAAALKNSAHALKGSTQNLGGDRLAAVCRLLEEQALSGDFERAGVLVEEVGKEFKVFTELLQADVDKGGTA